MREREFTVDDKHIVFIIFPVGSGIVRDEIYGYVSSYSSYKDVYVFFCKLSTNARFTDIQMNERTKSLNIKTADGKVLYQIPITSIGFTREEYKTKPISAYDIAQEEKLKRTVLAPDKDETRGSGK